MASQGREEYFHKIMVFFAVITAITAIFNLAASGDITLGNFGSGTLPGQVVVYGGGLTTQVVLTGQNFTSLNGYNPNISVPTTSIIGSYGTWVQSSSGYTLTGSGFTGDPAITIGGVQNSNGIYDVTYTYTNPGGDFFITPRTIYSSSGISNSNIRVNFENDGIHVKTFSGSPTNILGELISIVYSPDYFFYPMTGADDAVTGGTVRSVYNDNEKSLTLYQNGNYLFTVTGFNDVKESDVALGVYYAGIGSNELNFAVISVLPAAGISPSSLNSFQAASSDLIGSIIDAGATFLNLIAVCSGLTSNALVPFWLWAIIAIPCIATLVLIYLEMLRGN